MKWTHPRSELVLVALSCAAMALLGGCGGAPEQPAPEPSESAEADNSPGGATKSDLVGNKAEGDECTFNIECDSPLVCRPDEDFTKKRSICVPLGKARERCDESADCEEGLGCPGMLENALGVMKLCQAGY